MKRFFAALLAFTLIDATMAFADSTTGIPAAPKDWGVFIRGGLIAAGLWFAATVAGRLWITWRQRKTKPTTDPRGD
ncbi:MAG TPA: hypothetical protein VHQ39_14740 [Dongiaceae bacterium]|nr:hypothetical protein [Dongiaceae bacterium]